MHSDKIVAYPYYEDSPVPISQYKNEFENLLEKFNILKPQSVLELGTHHGGTLYQWLKYSPDGAKVVAVDDYHINQEMYSNWTNGKELIVIKGNTQKEETIEAVRRNGPYDFIFIDADHSYDGVKNDWENYAPMINEDENCLIAFHDIKSHPNSEVDQLWEDIKWHYPFWEFLEDQNQEGCGIGVILIEGKNSSQTFPSKA